MQNLPHSASFHAGEKTAPSKSGIKHLERERVPKTVGAVVGHDEIGDVEDVYPWILSLPEILLTRQLVLEGMDLRRDRLSDLIAGGGIHNRKALPGLLPAEAVDFDGLALWVVLDAPIETKASGTRV